MHAVFDADTGALVSTGTVVADPLPPGLEARPLGPDECAALSLGGTWDATARAVQPPPMPAAPGVMDDVTPWQIRLCLLARGWSAEAVDEAFAEAAGLA